MANLNLENNMHSNIPVKYAAQVCRKKNIIISKKDLQQTCLIMLSSIGDVALMNICRETNCLQDLVQCPK